MKTDDLFAFHSMNIAKMLAKAYDDISTSFSTSDQVYPVDNKVLQNTPSQSFPFNVMSPKQ